MNQTRSISIPSSSRSGPAGIFWDIGWAEIPISRSSSDPVPAEKVVANIRSALQSHPSNISSIINFSAFGSLFPFDPTLKMGLEDTGVRLVTVPKNEKPSIEIVMLGQMLRFIMENPPPSTIICISGDESLAQFLHILGQRGHTVVLAPLSPISTVLHAAGRYVWDWTAMARDGLLVPFLSTGLVSLPVTDALTSAMELSNQFASLHTPHDEENENEELNADEIERLIASFKIDVLELLIIYEYPIEIGDFEKLYLKEYGKKLDYRQFGVRGMEGLVEKVLDVVRIVDYGEGENKYLIPLVE